MQSPEPAAPLRRRGPSIVGPTILIGVGVVLLFQNLGLLPPTMWSNLWRLWPLALVLVGLELLAGGRLRGPAYAGVVVLVALAGVGLLATVSRTPAVAQAAAGQALMHSLEGATQVQVRMEFGAGRLDVGALSNPAPGQLAATTFTGAEKSKPDVTYRVRDGTGQLEIDQADHGPKFPFFSMGGPGMPPAQLGVQLTPRVPLALQITTGAATSQIDLSRLRVASLGLETGASTTTIRLPEAAGQTAVRVEGGAATITIEVPPDVAAQIRFEGGISTLQVEPSRFPTIENRRYRSPSYDTAANRADILLETGAATVTIR